MPSNSVISHRELCISVVGGVPGLGFGGNLPGNIKHAGGVAVFVADALGQGLARDDHECRQGFLLTELSPLELVAAGDRYGAALAVGDFNGDTRSDLAIEIGRASCRE